MGSIHAGHRKRMRERYAKHGLVGFSDHEILELLLFYALPRRNTNEIAHALLNRFGSLREIMRADPIELCKISGVSKQTSLFLHLLLDVCTLYGLQSHDNRPVFHTIDDVAQYVLPFYENKTLETPAVLLLDKKFRPLHLEFMEAGALQNVSVAADVVVRQLFHYNAAYFVLFHNHPASDKTSSEADLLVTRKWQYLFSQIGRPMLDHVLVTEKTFSTLMKSVIPGYVASLAKKGSSQK
jgi:DNA repair protein RadC